MLTSRKAIDAITEQIGYSSALSCNITRLRRISRPRLCRNCGALNRTWRNLAN